MDAIKIRGAREHNLKSVDIDIPRDKLVVITGVSGSGKSSLAFDTIYAEGQRRYVESLSAYARQFLDIQKKPEVDSIEGLSPAISIEQKTTHANPRSTVGTITEIYDYMRLLWARVGVPYSPETGLPIESQTVSSMVDKIMEMPEGTKLYLLAPVVRGKKGTQRDVFDDLIKQGFTRIRADGEFMEAEEAPDLNKNRAHTVEAVVDRVVVKHGIEERLAQSTETALKLADGIMIAENADTKEQVIFSENFSGPGSGFSIEEIEPRLFSFNNPAGACKACGGLGFEIEFSPALIVPDERKSIRRGAIAPWSRDGQSITQNEYLLDAVCKEFKISMDKPWREMSEKDRQIILYGGGEREIIVRWERLVVRKYWEGVIPTLERRYHETESEWARIEYEKYQENIPCPTCHGKRLSEKALCVKIDGRDIIEATEWPLGQTLSWFRGLLVKLSPKNREIAKPILKEIIDRTAFLLDVGLDYLTLSRTSGTLSGGESQRIRLASQIGTGLTGVLYVLDEPSIGLHQRDNDRLIDTLKKLRDKSNTVIVVEHDEDIMRQADHLIDIGVGAGIMGGRLIAQGTPAQVIATPGSLTAKYLSGELSIAVPKKRRPGNGEFLAVKGATHHNLQDVSVKIPLGTFTCITGVSGSGKSSLVLDTIYPLAMREINGSSMRAGAVKSISGLENFDKVIDINQSPIGRTPRSNPATYTGVFDLIREWFARLPAAKERGYGPGRFSFNTKGGRCEACDGDGLIRINMNFMADMYVECDVCHGKRYNRETLAVEYKGKNIADILDMTVDEAVRFFENVPNIREKLLLLSQVGLGYIHLGQSAVTLSGGEAQRIKLSKELSKRATGRTLYLLDEPTTGLHFHDIANLLKVLHRLVDSGNTVLVIEHNLEIIKTADYVIDMGPEGGDAGGRVIAQGTPEEVAKAKGSHTGKYLKKYLK
ncbi:MAG: excinuclease ABC subunit UvrA [Rickettsiales bacterium]|jgi:excinuclease ABC subunit A|nr:excinuclease ABC subunit UvrA [Rickettsiales bacterium]